MLGPRALGSLVGVAAAALAVVFALVMTVMVGWRNWLGWQKKPKVDAPPPKKKK